MASSAPGSIAAAKPHLPGGEVGLVTPLFRLFLRGRCRGMELVPLSGPLVVVANHGSTWIHRCWVMPCRGR